MEHFLELPVGHKAWAGEFGLNLEEFGDRGGIVLVVFVPIPYDAFIGAYALSAVDVDCIGALQGGIEPFGG